LSKAITAKCGTSKLELQSAEGEFVTTCWRKSDPEKAPSQVATGTESVSSGQCEWMEKTIEQERSPIAQRFSRGKFRVPH